ncbi:hypothetical protein D3C71_1474880 [compost metagenome]
MRTKPTQDFEPLSVSTDHQPPKPDELSFAWRIDQNPLGISPGLGIKNAALRNFRLP